MIEQVVLKGNLLRHFGCVKLAQLESPWIRFVFRRIYVKKHYFFIRLILVQEPILADIGIRMRLLNFNFQRYNDFPIGKESVRPKAIGREPWNGLKAVGELKTLIGKLLHPAGQS